MSADRVRVRLRAHLLNEFIGDKTLRRGKYFLAVSGPGLQLGFEDFSRAPRMTSVGYNSTVWTKDLWILKNSILSYKYLIIQRYTNEVLHCENIAKREVHVRTEPLTIDNNYNRVNIRGNNKCTKKINTRSNAYGQNTKAVQTKGSNKTIRSRDKGQTKVGNSKYQKQATDCGKEMHANNDTTRKEAKHKIDATLPSETDDKEKKNKIKDRQTTQSFLTEDKKMVQMKCNIHLDGETGSDIESNAGRKYVNCMRDVVKLGLFAIAAFGICKMVSRRFI
ncbi:hypothetical protein ACF0H5_004343 [Mactra antiquata]